MKQFNIQPDLLIQGRHGQRVVADTKYKVGTKPDPSDLYQMLAYCRVLNIANGVLFTVGTGQQRRYEVLDGVTTIEIIPVGLDGTVSDIDKSLLVLASRVPEMLTNAT